MQYTKLNYTLRPWVMDEGIDPRDIAGIPISWEVRRWYFNVKTGKFRMAVQNLKVDPKARKIRPDPSRPYRSNAISGGYHSGGTPLMDKDAVEKVYLIADDGGLPLSVAFQQWADSTEDGISPRVVRALKVSPKCFTKPEEEREKAPKPVRRASPAS